MINIKDGTIPNLENYMHDIGLPFNIEYIESEKYYIQLDNNNHIVEIKSFDGNWSASNPSDSNKIAEYQGFINKAIAKYQAEQTQKELEQKKKDKLASFLADTMNLTQFIDNELIGLNYTKIDYIKSQYHKYLKATFIDETLTDENALLDNSNIQLEYDGAKIQQAELLNTEIRGILQVFEMEVSVNDGKLLKLTFDRQTKIAQKVMNLASKINDQSNALKVAMELSMLVNVRVPTFYKLLSDRLNSQGELDFINNFADIENFTADTILAEQRYNHTQDLKNKTIYNILELKLFSLLANSTDEHLDAIIKSIVGDKLDESIITQFIQDIKQIHASRK